MFTVMVNSKRICGRFIAGVTAYVDAKRTTKPLTQATGGNRLGGGGSGSRKHFIIFRCLLFSSLMACSTFCTVCDYHFGIGIHCVRAFATQQLLLKLLGWSPHAFRMHSMYLYAQIRGVCASPVASRHPA